MFERANFDKGKNIDELTVFYCASLVDEIWVPTSWHESIMRDELMKLGFMNPQVYVIPESIDTKLFDPAVVRHREQQQSHSSLQRQELSRSRSASVAMDGTVDMMEASSAADFPPNDQTATFQFLSIFKWEYRKGWDILLRSYWNAFTVEDNVVLRIRSYVPAFHTDGGSKNITDRMSSFAEREFGKDLSELVRA
jgi:glycosyltransferase involved in cell wall biosynthesis